MHARKKGTTKAAAPTLKWMMFDEAFQYGKWNDPTGYFCEMSMDTEKKCLYRFFFNEMLHAPHMHRGPASER